MRWRSPRSSNSSGTETSEADGDVQGRKNPFVAFVDGLAIRLVFAGLIGLVMLFGWELIQHDSTPYWALSRTVDAALIDANDRIIQLTQWVIGTVLLVGTALIGLNWYQGERRYQNDRARDIARLEEFRGDLNALTEQVNNLKTDRESLASTLERAQRLLDFLDQAHQIHFTDRWFMSSNRLEELVTDYGKGDHESRRKIMVYVSEALKREERFVLEQVVRQKGKDEVTIRALEKCVVAFRPDFPQEAEELNVKVEQLRMLAEVSRIDPDEQPLDPRG